MTIKKVVVTGGPCAGKTVSMERIRKTFTFMGYTVLIIAETATQLISGGVAPWTCRSGLDYQKSQIRMQLAKEQIFEQAALTIPADKILIVCDRGALDTKCYITDEQYTDILSALGREESDVRNNYDAVFHLVSAAIGAEEHYSVSNNKTRVESIEEAAVLDKRLISCWNPHPHFYIIDNSTDFEGKLRRLICAISEFLGEKAPVEIERKFLIEYPDDKLLEGLHHCSKTEITQIYLKKNDSSEARIRKCVQNEACTFYHTVKRKGTAMARTELERIITEAEFEQLAANADTKRCPLHKTRYRIPFGAHCFEIDVYPFWRDKAIMEVELQSENEAITFPEFIKVLREVTGEAEFKNSALAMRKNPSDI